MQSTNHIVMIRPVSFRANEQTMESNAFQIDSGTKGVNVRDEAVKEFDAFTEVLKSANIEVLIISDTAEPETPDSIFPNNWISFHDDGTVVLYPMMAKNRRLERRVDILDFLQSSGYRYERIVDLSYFEKEDKFLEGTGSMVLDRVNKIAYACLSPRTNELVLDVFCREMDYTKVIFKAVDALSKPIYHTNVMMCVGSNFVVACLESFSVPKEKEIFIRSVSGSGKLLIEISLNQMEHFAGNMLEVKNSKGKSILVMSSAARLSIPELEPILNKLCPIISAPLDVIEVNGGGSARCMMAEIHLPMFEPK